MPGGPVPSVVSTGGRAEWVCQHCETKGVYGVEPHKAKPSAIAHVQTNPTHQVILIHQMTSLVLNTSAMEEIQGGPTPEPA